MKDASKSTEAKLCLLHSSNPTMFCGPISKIECRKKNLQLYHCVKEQKHFCEILGFFLAYFGKPARANASADFKRLLCFRQLLQGRYAGRLCQLGVRTCCYTQPRVLAQTKRA